MDSLSTKFSLATACKPREVGGIAFGKILGNTAEELYGTREVNLPYQMDFTPCTTVIDELGVSLMMIKHLDWKTLNNFVQTIASQQKQQWLD